MQPAVLVRLRPSGPWRSGPAQGGPNRVEEIFRSDRLFSALTLAMKQLGHLQEWLAATAESPRSQVTFTSLFPFQGDLLFAPPPATHWPPPASLVVSPSPVFLSKIRWQAARFVPLALVESLLTGQSILADQWLPDVESGCLLRRDRPSSSPFRTRMRSHAAVDRVSASAVDVSALACVEFESGSGVWCAARFEDENAAAIWNERLQAAFRLLADSGFGARRSSGWGHAEQPEFQAGEWPGLLFPKLRRNSSSVEPEDSASYWLLSLYSPGQDDTIDWRSGDYKLTMRGGFVAANGVLPAQKKSVRLVSEGSVLLANAEPVGAAVNVAPDGFSHPVYRCGFAVSLKLPSIVEPEPPPVVEFVEPTLDEASEPTSDEAAKSTVAATTEQPLAEATGPTPEATEPKVLEAASESAVAPVESTPPEIAQPAVVEALERDVSGISPAEPEPELPAPGLAPFAEPELSVSLPSESEPSEATLPGVEGSSGDPEAARSGEAGEPAESPEPVESAESGPTKSEGVERPGASPPDRENESGADEI